MGRHHCESVRQSLMRNNPLISVVLPVFNGERYLEEAIKSILDQTVKDFELIIVNDASTDRTQDIIDMFVKHDYRIKCVVNTVNLKLPKSLNVGFRQARGAFFTWISHDNIFMPTFLKAMLEGFELQKDVQSADQIHTVADIVYAPYIAIDEHGNAFPNQKQWVPLPLEYLCYRNVIGAAFMYRAEVHKALCGFDESLFLLEDYDFWVRSYIKKFSFKYIDKIHYKYRIHSNNLTSTRSLTHISIPYLYRIRKKFKHMPSTLPAAELQALEEQCRWQLWNCRKYLSVLQKFHLFGEIFINNPCFVMQKFYSKSCKRLKKHGHEEH